MILQLIVVGYALGVILCVIIGGRYVVGREWFSYAPFDGTVTREEMAIVAVFWPFLIFVYVGLAFLAIPMLPFWVAVKLVSLGVCLASRANPRI